MTTRPPLSPVASSSPVWLNSTVDMISAAGKGDRKVRLIRTPEARPAGAPHPWAGHHRAAGACGVGALVGATALNPAGGTSRLDAAVGDAGAEEGVGDDDIDGCHLSTYCMPDVVLDAYTHQTVEQNSRQTAPHPGGEKTHTGRRQCPVQEPAAATPDSAPTSAGPRLLRFPLYPRGSPQKLIISPHQARDGKYDALMCS
ncbi:hypothetical protein PAL_GLEAN10022774 [Pteropus alecto]|uniref:Uncharacterized protein n=1 Tax=Pteropus alecto TaxID=9402 RepID=L5K482_PTEAL|nr:hypothetical protein PAL_GLEAN10022774 [Pteropus alecto]